MYSFYGGRPGNSFVIVTTYQSINDMINAFIQGPDYTAVHYNEHVLISTPNKNDSDNGKIFRRGYNYQNNMGGAEYIGQIVGPSGPAPNLKIGTLNYVESKSNPTDGSLQTDDTGIQQWTTGDNGGLVPGKTDNGYNDSIKWRSFVVRTSDNTESIAYVGFEIPYPIIEFQTSQGTPYEQPNITKMAASDNQDHPFYQKWNIKIPKGIKGDSANNFRIKENDSHLWYDSYNYDNIGNPNPISHDLGPINSIKDITVSDDGTLTIFYTASEDYQNFVASNKIKWINNISLNSENGNLTVAYNNGVSPTVFQNAIQKITNIQVTDDGSLKVTYNDGQGPQTITEKAIKWIEKLELTADGRLLATYNTNDYQRTQLGELVLDEDNNPIKQKTNITEESNLRWITNMRVGDWGAIQVQYNTGTPGDENWQPGTWEPLVDINDNQVSLKFITNLDLDKNGNLIATYNKLEGYYDSYAQQEIALDGLDTYLQNNGLADNLNYIELYIKQRYQTDQLNEKPLKWIDEISQDGQKLRIKYNISETPQDFTLKYPESFDFDESNGQIGVTWAGQSSSTQIGSVDYITDTAIDPNGNLLFKFASGKHTQNLVYRNETNAWFFVGTIAPAAFGFDAENTTISNKYITGYLENRNLHFNLSTSYFLPTTITDIQITSVSEIKFSIDDSLSNSYVPDDPYLIQAGIAGLNFVFNNVLSESNAVENITPVNIYIESLGLHFTIDAGGEQPANIEWETRLSRLQASLYNQDGTDKLAQTIETLNSLKNNYEETQTDVTNLKTDTSNLKQIVDIHQNHINGTGSGMTAALHGGTNILSALEYLKKPSSKILTTGVLDGTGTSGRFMHTPGWTTSTGSWNENEDTQQIILTGEKRIVNQQHGYVLQWNRYDPVDHTGKLSNYIFFFIPKGFVTNKWRGLEIPLIGHFNQWGLKYIYIRDYQVSGTTTWRTHIHGYYNNNKSDLEYNGIKFNNNYWILSGIYGV